VPRTDTVHMMETPQEQPPEATRPYGRRAFLGVSALGLSSLFWGKSVWSAFSSAAQPFENALPASIVPSGWRIYTVASTMPTFDPKTWRLSIDGLVANPQTLTYADLRSLPRAEQVSTFHCVTGWSVEHVHWAGVRFRDLLAAAQPHSNGTVLEFVSAEAPYFDTLTLKQAELHDAMLAYEMNGAPLPREHGAPVRVVIPEMYGYKNTKWVQKINVTDEVTPGYWEQRGYDVDAWVGKSNGL
jgi:DMSO/TMAO reductase YedYZ molybdopterin-dependent catalytic subunit